MDETLKQGGWAHYKALVDNVKRKIAGDAAVKIRDSEQSPEDPYDRRGFCLFVEDGERPIHVEYFPYGDSADSRLADQPFLIVHEWGCGAFFVEISRHYPQRYWNTDIAVTGYVDFREAEESFSENEEPEPHFRLSNDEMAERLLQTLALNLP